MAIENPHIERPTATPATTVGKPSVKEKAKAKVSTKVTTKTLASATAVSKPAAKPVAKPAAKSSTGVSAKPTPLSAAKPSVAKVTKTKKPKMVRDSFSFPKAEYAVLDALKLRAAKLGNPAKKTELLRAGVKAIAAMQDAALLAALKAVPSLKTGRPAKSLTF